MFAIYKRELKSYFQSVIGWLFMAAILFFVGLYYTIYNLVYGYAHFSYVISAIIFVFLLSVPILCMRIMSEERKNKTDQLILTAPITVGKIVAGKYLALLTIFAIPTLLICMYPLVLSAFGTIPVGETYLAILSFFLYGMASIAICLWVSSLTESQVIAAVLGFGVLFLGYMMNGILGAIFTTDNFLTKILSCYDMYTPFANLLNGTLELTSVVYFISLTLLALFLTTQSVQKKRYSISKKSLSLGAYSTGMIAMAVVITVVVNMIAAELPAKWTSLDLTSQKLYSITEQTKTIVEAMQEDVTIYALVKEENVDATVGQTLKRYEELSEHVKVEYVDPTANPMFHTQYTSDSISTHSLIVVGEKRHKVIDYSSLYETELDYSTYSYTTTGYDAEGQITSAIDYVTSNDIPKAYILEGHGEYTLTGSFTEALAKENIETETINLMNYEQVPEDAACLIINAPSSDFSTDDKDKVIAYLEQGGKVITSSMYTEDEMSNYKGILEYMGITLVDGIVVEGNQNNYYQSPFYLLPDMESNEYTSSLYGKYYIFAPYAQGMKLSSEEDSVAYTEILKTSDDAYAKTDLQNVSDYGKAEGDEEGPFTIGVEAVKTLEDTQAVLVAYSSSEIFTDNASQMVSGANQILFSNTVSQFTDHEVSTSIPVKSYEVSTLTMAQADIFIIAGIVTILLPLSCMIFGIVIWLKRRKQ